MSQSSSFIYLKNQPKPKLELYILEKPKQKLWTKRLGSAREPRQLTHSHLVKWVGYCHFILLNKWKTCFFDFSILLIHTLQLQVSNFQTLALPSIFNSSLFSPLMTSILVNSIQILSSSASLVQVLQTCLSSILALEHLCNLFVQQVKIWQWQVRWQWQHKDVSSLCFFFKFFAWIYWTLILELEFLILGFY